MHPAACEGAESVRLSVDTAGISDWWLPRIDGRQLLANLKLDPQTPNIKVVMFSGEEDQITRHDCFEVGAVDYFTKPLDPLFFRRLSKIAGLQVHY